MRAKGLVWGQVDVVAAHGHHSHHHHHVHGEHNEARLRWALGLTSVFLVVEAVAGFLTHSLALLSDAGHMLTDAAALGVALLAIQIGKRPADSRRTYGYYRFEILAAALNAGAMFAVAAFIFVEAYERFRNPAGIHSEAMLVVAVAGLAINFASLRMLAGGTEESLNVKGAYLEVWSDMLASAGVIAAALFIRFTGWTQADPLIAVLIGLWVLPRSWGLLSDSVHVLLEGVPEGLRLEEIEAVLLAVPGVESVHDLHVWSITTGRSSLTAHLRTAETADADEVTRRAAEVLEHRFGLRHTTLQTERGERCHNGPCEIERIR